MLHGQDFWACVSLQVFESFWVYLVLILRVVKIDQSANKKLLKFAIDDFQKPAFIRPKKPGKHFSNNSIFKNPFKECSVGVLCLKMQEFMKSLNGSFEFRIVQLSRICVVDVVEGCLGYLGPDKIY